MAECRPDRTNGKDKVIGVYKYVYKNEIIYVGKSDNNIFTRIDAHSLETGFLPYLYDCKIYYVLCKNPAHTTILETYLINKYKPVLNTLMKYDDDLDLFIQEPKWIEYNDKNIERLKKSKYFHIKRYKEIEYLQSRIIGTIILPRILTENYDDLIHNQYQCRITIPNNNHYKNALTTSVVYNSKRCWFCCRVCKASTYDDMSKPIINVQIVLDEDFVKLSFSNSKYKEKLRENLNLLRKEQIGHIGTLIGVELLPKDVCPEEYKWIWRWVSQEQTKRN